MGKERPCWLVQEGTLSGGVCGALSPAGDVEAEQRRNVVNGTIPQLEEQRKGAGSWTLPCGIWRRLHGVEGAGTKKSAQLPLKLLFEARRE